MKNTVYKIADRTQVSPAEVRHPGQFTLEQPLQTDVEIVLGVNWSLYCLDMQRDRALFVELPMDTDLSAAPFVYGAQFDGALRVASVPLELLPDLAMQVPEPGSVSLVMSTGRCGSTLASRVLARIPGVWSLSEPDCFTNLALARFELTQGQLQTLIAACTRLTCRPPAGSQTETVVLKPRSEMMVQAPDYVGALTGMAAVFLYRDCFGYVNSLYRFAQRVAGMTDPAAGSALWEVGRRFCTINAPTAFLRDFFEDGEDIRMMDLMTLAWTLRMRAYLEAPVVRRGVAPIHYADLTSDRRSQTALLLRSCRVDIRHLDEALQGFDRDSHSGSAGENAVTAKSMTDREHARVAELTDRWGISDYVKDRLPPI